MNEMKKPPLGATPYFVEIPHRICELNKAIYENAMDEKACKATFNKIKTWANEIVCHCNTMITMMNQEDDSISKILK